MLPSKTIPEVNRKRHACILKGKAKAKVKMTRSTLKNKARDCSIKIEETEDDDHPCNDTTGNPSLNTSIESISSFQFSHTKKVLCYYIVCDFISIRVLEGKNYEEESDLFVL